MKIEEAIDYINIMLGNGCMWDGFTQDGKEAFMESLEMGKKALEKQIPKKVIIEKNGAKRCPSCGVKHFNPNWKPEVCNCTQKLDWGKE